MRKKFIARLFDELAPCYPDTDVKSGVEEYTVSAVNGSYAGVNILLSGLTPGIPISVEVLGKSTAYKLFNMLPVPVEVNTGAKQRSAFLKNDTNPTVIRKAPFMIYEVLEPFFNIIQPTTEVMAFSFKTIVEYVKAYGISKWTFKITHGNKTIELILNVEEFPVTVEPAGLEHNKFVNWYSFGNICRYHHTPIWSNEFYNMFEKYMRAAYFSRQNMFAVPLDEFFELEQGHCVLQKDRLKRIIDIVKGVGMCYFEGSALVTRAEGVADNQDFYNSIDKSNIKSSDEIAEQFKLKAFELFDYGKTAKISKTGELIPGKAGEARLSEMLSAVNEFITENNLREVWLQSALDEPNDALVGAYKVITDITHREMPGIKILEPVLPTKKVIGMMDVWCPSVDVYEQNQDFFEARVKEGDRLFTYTCLTPGGSYVNRLLDMQRTRVVMIAWAMAKYEHIEGFLHWGGNYLSGGNPYTRSAAMFSERVLEFHPKRAMFLPAGDCCIFYPGYNEPLISTRSEAHRMGFEDLALLTKLKQKNAAMANEIISSMFKGYGDFEMSVSKYREARRKIYAALAD